MHKFCKLNLQNIVVSVLAAISIIGIVGIPLGDPKFLIQAFGLEFSFIVLAILSAKKYGYVYIPNFVIAIMVIVGNTVSPKHLEIMSTLHPFYNGIVLIVGGYILQATLLVVNTAAYIQYRSLKMNKIT